MTLELGWYVPTAKQCAPRWLLAASDSHCLYSNGRTQRECKVKTFRRWARKVQAAIGGQQSPQEARNFLSLSQPPQPSIASRDAAGRMR